MMEVGGVHGTFMINKCKRYDTMVSGEWIDVHCEERHDACLHETLRV
jgi:hypothetical protein